MTDDLFLWFMWFMKKCTKCKIPLDGIMYKISSALFGIRPSEKKEGVCNKCECKEDKTDV
ncbi:MAG: hypothetical protein UW24_C0009G0009 [Parcubacteria group bacterium GW2011_GWA2_44_12]|nr:MAG: hypothetical protein UW24_C0009G0009 [Parcubacteria group bacterium GW2011_GWA2_44_12]